MSGKAAKPISENDICVEWPCLSLYTADAGTLLLNIRSIGMVCNEHGFRGSGLLGFYMAQPRSS